MEPEKPLSKLERITEFGGVGLAVVGSIVSGIIAYKINQPLVAVYWISGSATAGFLSCAS